MERILCMIDPASRNKGAMVGRQAATMEVQDSVIDHMIRSTTKASK